MNIFLSHVHEEYIVADAIKAQLLTSFGSQVDVFLAEEIPLGRNWFTDIRKALQRADLVLALFSNRSKSRPWVNIEAGYAVMSEKLVVPLCLPDLDVLDLPMAYAMLQAMAIENPAQVRKLFDQIASHTAAAKFLGDRNAAVEAWRVAISHALAIHSSQSSVDAREQERIAFRRFFGGTSSPTVVAVFQDSFAPEFTIHLHKDTGPAVALSTPPRGEDPDQGVVFEDVQAGIAISRLCAQMDAPFEAHRDGYQHLHNDKTIVAIGLHNGASYKACRLCPTGFVELKIDGGFEKGNGTKMANFRVCGTDFTQIARFRKDIPRSEALVVRTRDTRSGLPYFLCGGHDGQGTAAAGIFLAENWLDLLQLFGADHHLDRDALAVVIEFDHDDPVNGLKRIVNTQFERLPG